VRRLSTGTALRTKARRPFWLWIFALWLLGLGIASIWRSALLWRMRILLTELDGRLSPAGLRLFVILYLLCGVGLVVSAVALWWRRDWGRRCAQVFLGCYMVGVQAYVWLAVQSGLLWERRWVSLALAALGMAIGMGALSWRVSRGWLGLSS
jgi:hypothetical protein